MSAEVFGPSPSLRRLSLRVLAAHPSEVTMAYGRRQQHELGSARRLNRRPRFKHRAAKWDSAPRDRGAGNAGNDQPQTRGVCKGVSRTSRETLANGVSVIIDVESLRKRRCGEGGRRESENRERGRRDRERERERDRER